MYSELLSIGEENGLNFNCGQRPPTFQNGSRSAVMLRTLNFIRSFSDSAREPMDGAVARWAVRCDGS